MKFLSRPQTSFLCAASVIALSPAARAQEAASTPAETIVVTGSRVISDVANSPTPITAVSTADLLRTTPTDIPNALNKLPVFLGSSTPTDPNNSSNGVIGNVLNLRNFGAQRTLVLLDGHRVAPSNASGTIDIDTLPQTLMQRVDVVTGGASAVYGSDAVTGVVNFVLNTHFSGLKAEAQAGISNYTDGASQMFNVAAGTDLFGGRGHLEGAMRYYHLDPILLGTRKWGYTSSWTAQGAGTKAQPLTNTPNSTFTAFAYGGKITCTGCAANNMQFGQNGVITPFVLGAPSLASNIAIGGDGGTNQASNAQQAVMSYQDFERFSYNINDTTTAYVQVTAAQSRSSAYHVLQYLQTGSSPNQVFVNNPFLSPTAQALLANPSGKFTDTQYWTFPYYQGNYYSNINRNLSAQVGVDGTIFGKYDWDLYYSHGENRLKSNQLDQSNTKIAAAMDAVVNPANGQIVCQVSLTQYASLYPGCVPMNRFGPTATTTSQFNYMLFNDWAITQQRMDDISGSVSGEVFELPAGPIKAAIDGEYRRLSYGVQSVFPAGTADCTGLRLCVSGMAQAEHGGTLPRSPVSDNVWEFAGEVNAPLLKDLPFVQTLDLNLAGRYTDYSISGAAETWKVGLDYHVNDTIHFRATTSVDIRAPTLQDLYAPESLNHTGFNDIHTGNQNQQAFIVSSGNANLIPEVARTYTAGVVLTPSFIPGLTMSADYYQIKLKNAITSVSGVTAGVQDTCEKSGGTSPLCALFIRPLPFADTSQANYPTRILSTTLNASVADTSGVDVETNYGFELGDVWDGMPGGINLRSFMAYQPANNGYSYPTAPLVVRTEPKFRATTFVTYSLNNWTFDLSDRFFGKFARSTQPGTLFYAEPYGKALNFFDVNVAKKFTVDGNSMEAYFNIQNLLNSAPPIEPQQNANAGSIAYGAKDSLGNIILGVDDIGRYFTIGVRATF